MQQYQIVIVQLDPTVGAEIQKTRPCVIVSPNEMNKHLNTVIICPLTTQAKANYPTRIEFDLNGVVNYVVIDQIRTIDKTRIGKPIGYLPSDTIEDLKRVIREMLVD